jgi:hypothetical protein
MPVDEARLGRTLINPDDYRQPKRAIPERLRLTNTEALPIAASFTNARPKERSGLDGVSPYQPVHYFTVGKR